VEKTKTKYLAIIAKRMEESEKEKKEKKK